jgi:hypothetical protein
VANFDLNILPIHRQNGQEFADLPGLLAIAPPRKAARGRDKDSLVLYLMLSGNADFSTAEVKQLISNAASSFYQNAGSLTSAMRKTAENINTTLLERNLSTTGRGQYAIATLVLAVIRENQCTVSLSGPAHVVWVTDGQQRYIHDPALSGKGLGSSQNIQTYLSQIEFKANDLIALCGKFPKDWEADLLNERPPASLDASYRKLTFTKGDLNATLIQPQNGRGIITVLRPDVSASRPLQSRSAPVIEEPIEPPSFDVQPLETRAEPVELNETNNASFEPEQPVEENQTQESSKPSITEEDLDALAELGIHLLQPSAYAIPPQPDNVYAQVREETPATAPTPSGPRSFPPSIPRAKPVEPVIVTEEPDEEEEQDLEPEADTVESAEQAEKKSRLAFLKKPEQPDAHAEAARQMAKVMVGGIKTGRRMNERISDFLKNYIPKLIPNAEETSQPFVIPSYVMILIAIIIPIMMGAVSWVVYSKYGLNERFNQLYLLAKTEKSQADSEIDPSRQRDMLNNVIKNLDQAVQLHSGETDETKLLRAETQAKLDNLMGVIRLEFIPAFTNGLGGSIQISRMAASESDLYMLDAERGNVLHATFTGRSLEQDAAFNCQPGTYGGYQVGTIVDILALPKINAVGATVLGIDATGNLLYCAPGQVPQVFPLPPLPNTNWGRITSFVLDNDNLYILDAQARAVWVYRGRNSSFVDLPYFFFGSQIPNIDNAIDLAVSGDDLYMLHTDGHLSTCNYSRMSAVPTRCVDPAPRIDNYPAHKDLDIFAQAHLTQMLITNPPNSVVILLDAEDHSVLRLSPRSLELQNKVSGYTGTADPFQSGPVGAMAISPNYVLYLAIGNQVYFATNLP